MRGTSQTHIQRDNVSGAQGAFVPSTSHDADSFYELVLTTTDSKGLTGTARVVVRPETVSFTLDSAPAGAPLTYGGDAVTAPSTRRAAVGFATSVSAAERFERDGRTYGFDHWSDDGAALHDITVPAAAATLTAHYREVASAPPFGGGVGGAGVLSDRTGPALALTSPAVRVARRGPDLVTGTARDPAGVRTVDVSVRRALRRGERSCHWWSRPRGRLAASGAPCVPARWMRAALTSAGGTRVAWRLDLRGHLAPGSYVLAFRAEDRLRHPTRALADGRRSVRVDVRR
ncbi:MAG: hypothetical protein ACR2NH_07460 [Solirubrobacteraceae bacterium]